MDQISIDSFSYSWLRDGDNGGAFIDVYPRLLSLRWSSEPPTNFNITTFVDDGKDFNFHLSPTSEIRSFFHNDELTGTSPVPFLLRPVGEAEGRFFRRCLKTSKKIMWKYLCLFVPVSRVIGMIKGIRLRRLPETKVDGRRVWSAGGGGFSWTEFDDEMERLIDDAVLHCKKSIANVDQVDQSQELYPLILD